MISILMPLYNGVEYLNESVQSVLDQMFQEWELIIAVNGYEPNSFVYLIAKDYESIDNRIRVYDMHQIHGKANTLNEMIPLCSYSYVAILDVDDIWLPDKLKKQVEILKTDQYDVVGSKCVYFENLDGVIPKIPSGAISSFNFKEVNPIINSSAVFRKKFGFWKEDFSGVEDYELWVRLWKEGKQFYNLDEVLVKHRIHPTSAFNTQDHSAKIKEIKNCINI
jgi:glycosyltransferase involved in cell wall biosynthesis